VTNLDDLLNIPMKPKPKEESEPMGFVMATFVLVAVLLLTVFCLGWLYDLVPIVFNAGRDLI
jgi:hypothetical protein